MPPLDSEFMNTFEKLDGKIKEIRWENKGENSLYNVLFKCASAKDQIKILCFSVTSASSNGLVFGQWRDFSALEKVCCDIVMGHYVTHWHKKVLGLLVPQYMYAF